MNGKAKILLVDSCYEADSLSQYEFVRPVQRILERTGFPCQVCHISLLNEERLKSCDKVVLCGTALKDNEYLNHLERYTWLKEGDRPVLGICAGMQIIAAIFGGEVRSRHKPAIGLEMIEVANVDNVGMVVDFWHLWSGGETKPEEVARLNKDRIYNIHFCDGKKQPRDTVWDETILRGYYPGDGDIPVSDWVDAVKATGYDGFWSCELVSAKHWEMDVLEVARNMKQYMDAYIG